MSLGEGDVDSFVFDTSTAFESITSSSSSSSSEWIPSIRIVVERDYADVTDGAEVVFTCSDSADAFFNFTFEPNSVDLEIAVCTPITSATTECQASVTGYDVAIGSVELNAAFFGYWDLGNSSSTTSSSSTSSVYDDYGCPISSLYATPAPHLRPVGKESLSAFSNEFNFGNDVEENYMVTISFVLYALN